MSERAAKPVNGIKRKVTFQAWCHRCLFGWVGPERDLKSLAAFDMASHDVDRHGGAFGRGDGAA